MTPPLKRTFLGFELFSPGEYIAIGAFIAQFFLCLGGGGWAGYASDASSTGLFLGALGLLAAWTAGLFASNKVAMVIASIFLVRSGIRWMRGNEAVEPVEQRNARRAREDRIFDFVRTATAILILFVLAIPLAVVVWYVAADASLLATVGRFIGVALLVNLIAPLAIRVFASTA